MRWERITLNSNSGLLEIRKHEHAGDTHTLTPTHLSDVKPHPCENNTHTHRAQPLYRKTNPTPAWPWPPHPHKHRRTLPLGFCVSANTGTPEVQCLCSRSVSKSMIVYLSFHIRVYTCVCLQKQCIRGLRGLLVNSGEIKAAARRCRVMALCVGVSFNSLAELHCVCELVLVRCMYIFMSVWRRVCVRVEACVCACGWLAVCLGDSGASSGFHLSCLSETIIHTPAMQMHTNTVRGQVIALSMYASGCVCVCKFVPFSHYHNLKLCSFINAVQCSKYTSKQGLYIKPLKSAKVDDKKKSCSWFNHHEFIQEIHLAWTTVSLPCFAFAKYLMEQINYI